MAIKQLSVFAENTPGILFNITDHIAAASVSIRAISVSDTQDFGILRVVVSDPDKAKEYLSANGFVVSITQVLGIELCDRPGGLAGILKLLADAGINVDYVYACVTAPGKSASVILHVDDTVRAESILSEEKVSILTEEDIRNI